MVNGRAIPKNSTCIAPGDYVPYLRSALSARPAQPEVTAEIFGHLLPNRQLMATATGRHALWAFLQAAPLREGDEVLVSAYNFYVIVRLLIQRGLRPVFVDVEPETLCMDPHALEPHIGPRTRMVLVTHMYGHPANMSAIQKVCSQHNLLLFEDCAHSLGTTHNGLQTGQSGDGALFSFGVEKLINSFGGGMLAVRRELFGSSEFAQPHVPPRHSVTDTFTRFIYTAALSPRVYANLLCPAGRALAAIVPSGPRKIREFFEPSKDDPAYRFAFDSRPPFKPFMAEMQKRQIARLETNIARRRELVHRMRFGLKGMPEVRLPEPDRHGQANASYFVISVANPYSLADHLRHSGIGAHPQEFLDCSQLDQFAALRADCPAARHASGSVLRLPSFPAMSDGDADRVVETIRSYFISGAKR